MAGSSAEINGDGEMTPLQKHAAFFDRNNDGVIYPWETFEGFRAIGAGLGLSIVSAVFINGFLGPKTRPGKIPSPLFPIYVKNISKGKHGSDTGAYDAEGRKRSHMMSNCSATSSSFRMRRHHFCRCGLQAVLLTCTKVDNYGKKFFKCPRNRTSGDCKYFTWTEEFADLPYDDDNSYDFQVKERLNYLVQMNKIVIARLIIIIVMFFVFYLAYL